MGPAHHLKGLDLDDGWTVVEAVKRKPNATGGCFSVGYLVARENGDRGFMKALDYTWAFRAHFIFE